jgi:hypothetical protein
MLKSPTLSVSSNKIALQCIYMYNKTVIEWALGQPLYTKL